MTEILAAQVTDALLQIPYAQTLGITARMTEGELILIMPFKPDNVGNPMLPALHGGAIGGLMEMAAICQLLVERSAANSSSGKKPSRPRIPKPIGVNIDYLRRGRPVQTYARAVVFKSGKRVSNVRVEAWQDERDKPIAALHGHFLNVANASD